MSSTLFNSASFQYTLTFIERLLQKEDNVFNLIDLCHNDPTLSLNLHIILEAIEMEKLLEDSLGCSNDAMWSGVQIVPNEEWTKPQEVIDLTSPASSRPPTPPPPSPLSSLPSLISEFGDLSSSSTPSLHLD